MNVLLIGSDPTIFQTGKAVFGEHDLIAALT
jgi:hypothetical protein